jgi:uncharacterized protein
MNEQARALIARLGLEPLPQEGGFFRRTWTSPNHFAEGRSVASAITFLLTEADFSALHRLTTDEIWCFHAGDPVEHIQLSAANEQPVLTRLGTHFLREETPQLVVRGGNWQGARLLEHKTVAGSSHGWALMSCIMAPAWDEREFTLGNRAELRALFPLAERWIKSLTR